MPSSIQFLVLPRAPEDIDAIDEADAPEVSSTREGGESATASATIVELVSGSFYRSVSAIWSGTRAVEYLTAPDARRHLWHAWLSIRTSDEFERNALSATLAHGLLSSARAKALMMQAYGSCPPGLTNTLGRLGATARAPHAYRALVAILAQGGPAAKHFHHAKSPSDALLVGLAALPPDIRCASTTIRLFLKGAFGPQKMGVFAWALARVEELYGTTPAEHIISAPRPWEALWDVVYDHDFPSPPFPDIGRLEAVRSFAHLKEVAERLGNCLNHTEPARAAFRQIANGYAYFYEWQAEESALLKFRKVGVLGWRLDEARGIRNEWLSDKTMAEIAQTLSTAPSIFPLVESSAIGIYLDRDDRFHCDYE